MEHITDIAFDMHQASITAAWLLPRATVPEVRTIPHEPKAFHRLARQLLAAGPARSCYEAGPCGYAPQRQLAAWILPCEVIVPALIPRRPGVRMAREAEERQRGTLSGSRRGRGTAAPFPAPAGVAPADQDRRARTVSSLRPHPPPPGVPSSARQTGAGESHKENKEATSRITRVSRGLSCCLPPRGNGVGAPGGNFRSSIAPPADALVYASSGTSRCRPQDSGSGWSRLLLSCRALASPAPRGPVLGAANRGG